jgi:hypothetical protein
LLLDYFTFCSKKTILAFVFPMKSDFSKIDENIADAPYGVNSKAPRSGGSWQPAAPRQARDRQAESVMQKVLTLAVGCGTLLGVFAKLPNCGYL